MKKLTSNFVFISLMMIIVNQSIVIANNAKLKEMSPSKIKLEKTNIDLNKIDFTKKNSFKPNSYFLFLETIWFYLILGFFIVSFTIWILMNTLTKEDYSNSLNETEKTNESFEKIIQIDENSFKTKESNEDSSQKQQAKKQIKKGKYQFLKNLKVGKKKFLADLNTKLNQNSLEDSEINDSTFNLSESKKSFFDEFFTMYNSKNQIEIIQESFNESISESNSSFYMNNPDISCIPIQN